MQIINSAYQVLSAEETRRQYDGYLKRLRLEELTPLIPKGDVATEKLKATFFEQIIFTVKILAGSAVCFWLLIIWLAPPKQLEQDASIASKATLIPTEASSRAKNIPPLPQETKSIPIPAEPVLIKEVEPIKAGSSTKKGFTQSRKEALPKEKGYLSGYKMLASEGRSSLTIDNSLSGISVKVLLVNSQTGKTQRACFIPKGETFRMDGLTRGFYDVRYRNVETGELFKTEWFQLEEYTNSDVIHFSNVSLTIYKVEDGNMKTTSIAESDFPE